MWLSTIAQTSLVILLPVSNVDMNCTIFSEDFNKSSSLSFHFSSLQKFSFHQLIREQWLREHWRDTRRVRQGWRDGGANQLIPAQPGPTLFPPPSSNQLSGHPAIVQWRYTEGQSPQTQNPVGALTLSVSEWGGVDEGCFCASTSILMRHTVPQLCWTTMNRISPSQNKSPIHLIKPKSVSWLETRKRSRNLSDK